jgi:glycine/D-amino acid oxidase-like deaminating enzyme
MHSYWENNSWFKDIDIAIIGSGITGLSTAIHLKKKEPKLKIVVLEKGMLPSGASTKNAGFACFGSIGELIDDLETNSEEEVFKLVEKRKKGLDGLIELIGEKRLDFKRLGGFELFSTNELFSEAKNSIDRLNQLLGPIFSNERIFEVSDNSFGFEQTTGIIKNHFEGQIDTGKMMQSYISLARELGIELLNGVEIKSLVDEVGKVYLHLNSTTSIEAKKVVVCSNGFASQLLPEEDVLPARAQVLITKPIKNLEIKGTFHVDRGYYYFRNIHNRILLGGGRNLDVVGETTTQLVTTSLIQDSLETMLTEVILPNTPYEIDQTWSGVMGVGKGKGPIVKQLSQNVFCGVRLGGMGVALGTQVGKDCADLLM